MDAVSVAVAYWHSQDQWGVRGRFRGLLHRLRRFDHGQQRLSQPTLGEIEAKTHVLVALDAIAA